jgi:anionic cell wall polymer biosynthesis LytR-Cps2A-Psr (LCP) family protein
MAADKSAICGFRCIIYPMGGVRVTFTDGTVIQAGKVTITTLSNGKQQLDGEEFHLLPAKG